ncbi:transmembrane protein, putative (macronuclear) [Tetrahymena thermophila SB210]|uniref:Transmembrane protein, putative n=1 Tax=Tetrahymena thermophila (strain SB210) TaxID=312017 RepID=I7ME68_TETTS|nr:transmembrane protein, putative [Tetrahymena thermophila SB210]EAR95610.1 transmembrane protein, putative [Tetrahymena thermophila SB210]|eukprot:XP_001015855.1 transmembrane protein, putative [Tetrahymena thermophila SB210]
MIQVLSKNQATYALLKYRSIKPFNAVYSNQIFAFSSNSDYNKMIKSLQEKNILIGKAQFRQLYFPIKRIHFEENNPFQKIYQNPQQSLPNIRKKGRLMRFFYHIPFFTYLLNYVFFLPPSQLVHEAILASLFISANLKSFTDTFKYSREIGELYINNDAQKYIAIFPKYQILRNINELQGKIKGSQYEPNQALGFQFTLDDIEQISLVSNDQQKIKDQLNEKIGTKKAGQADSQQKLNQAEQKQQILEKLKNIEENDEALIITISKDTWNCARTFRLNLKDNQLPQYNDYMIALGCKQRIVMRESMAPKTEQSKTETADQEKKNEKEQQNFEQKISPNQAAQ